MVYIYTKYYVITYSNTYYTKHIMYIMIDIITYRNTKQNNQQWFAKIEFKCQCNIFLMVKIWDTQVYIDAPGNVGQRLHPYRPPVFTTRHQTDIM